ncbi:MAG TPA: JAB domain-containing protein [Thermodesulfobacteriota bacterium]|nr:JAB domain-containing protein [Thermodesulfobacteriota bacterium]
MTRRLVEAGKLVGIEVVDHVIVGKNGCFSFQAEGFLKVEDSDINNQREGLNVKKSRGQTD